jgi:hypothetical protein
MTDFNNDRPKLNTPITRLPRSAQRAAHVWAAHEGTDPNLDAQGAAVVEASDRFSQGQLALDERESQLTASRLQLAVVMRELLIARRSCLATVLRAVPDFDTTGLTSSRVTEDLIAETRSLHQRAETRVVAGASVPQGEQLLASLASSLGRVEEAAAALHAADSAAAQARAERFAAAVALDDRLIAFRATLREVLGSSHRDYRKLRARVGHGAFEDDLELDAVDAEEAIDEPAPVEGPELDERPSVTNGAG